MRTSMCMMAAAMTCLVAISSVAEVTKRAITPEDIVNIRIVDDPKISPDGKLVAFTVTEPADTSKPDEARNSDIWIVSTNGHGSPRKYAFGPKQEITPRWSPDGSYLAFLSNRGNDDKNQIYVMSAVGGEAEALTGMKEGVTLFKWDRDSRNITFISQDSFTTNEETQSKAKDDERVQDENIKHARLYRMDLTSRSITLLTQNNESINDFDYSPDGSQIAYEVATSPKLDDVYYRSKLMVMNRDGSARHIISEKSSGLGNIRWSPDSKQILHFIYPGRAEMVFPELVSPVGVRTAPLEEDYFGAIFEMAWHPKQQEILVSSQEGVQGIIGRVNIRTRKISRLREVGRPYWSYSNLSINADGEWIAYVDASSSSPMDIWIMKEDGSNATCLTDFNPQVSSLAFGSEERVQWKAKDGTEIEGVLVKPVGYVPGMKYPLVVMSHGGPAWGWWIGWLCDWYDWAQLLACNGFAVLLPNPRGSACCGWKFAEPGNSWGGEDFNDIMSGVDYLIGQGIADSTQLAIGGWSYGGYMTEWAVTRTNRFKAAIAVSGLSNLTSFYGTTDTPTFFRWYFEDYPYGPEQVYEQRSPITFIESVTTPTLILHGESDVRVPISQSYEFYRGLRDMGVETKFVIYPREPHGIGESAHQLDVLQRVLDWYKTHLSSPK